MPGIVCNASPLIVLAKADLLKLLPSRSTGSSCLPRL